MSKLSIIIPVYNVEKYLSKCLNSILRQTYQDYEIILIDDGSSDSSGIICDWYADKDSRIKVVHQPNKGVSCARNAGLELSKGEFITFIDADDELCPHFLENFSYNPEIDFEIQGFIINNVNDKTKNKVIKPAKTLITSLYNVYAESEYQKTSRGPCCKLLKNNIIKQYHIKFPAGISFGEDAIFIKRYLVHCSGKARSVAEADYCYNHYECSNSLTQRQHPAQVIYDAAWLDFQLYEQLEDNWGRMPVIVDQDFKHIRALEFYLSLVTYLHEKKRPCKSKNQFFKKAKREMFPKIKNQIDLPITYCLVRFCLSYFPIPFAVYILNVIFQIFDRYKRKK